MFWTDAEWTFLKRLALVLAVAALIVAAAVGFLTAKFV